MKLIHLVHNLVLEEYVAKYEGGKVGERYVRQINAAEYHKDEEYDAIIGTYVHEFRKTLEELLLSFAVDHSHCVKQVLKNQDQWTAICKNFPEPYSYQDSNPH